MRCLGIMLLLMLLTPVFAAEKGTITASGFGTTDLTLIKVKSQAKMMARRAALVDAQRNLTEQVKGVRLTGGTTMQEYEISSDIVATRVKSLLLGAFEVDQIVTEDEQSISIEIVLAICVTDESDSCKDRPTLSEIESIEESPAAAQQ